MKFLQKLSYIAVLLLIHNVFALLQNNNIYAAYDHVVISEILIGTTGNANDEFIELYNPTGIAVDMTGWRLKRTQTSAQNYVSSMTGTIPAHGYFLIANPSYSGTVTADLPYSATSSTITTGSTIVLTSDIAGTVIVDKVGIGLSSDFETLAAIAPATGNSLERKALAGSTALTMSTGGSDEMSGNGYDSDNNSTDFVIRDSPNPQNSHSQAELIQNTMVTPTDNPQPSPTPFITITLTPIPTDTSTITPTPSDEPTPTVSYTPTSTDTPTETPKPTDIPEIEPSSTPAVPTPTVILNVTPTPIIEQKPDDKDVFYFHFRHQWFHCHVTYQKKTYYRHTWYVPQITCHLDYDRR